MEDERARQLLAFAAAQRDEMAAFLKRLVRAESPSTVPEAQQDVLALLDEALGALDFQTRRLPGRATGGHLYARPRERARRRPLQLLLGHCDTVWPLGTLRQMPATISDGRMRGPGVYDMKGGLAQMVFALRALRTLGLTPPVTPVVFVNSDEEIGSGESTPTIRRLARCADRAFVLEPALGRAGLLKTSRRGAGRFTVEVQGRSAHAGLDPAAGASAIVELSHVIQKLHALNDAGRGVSVNVGMIEGGVLPNVVAPTSRAVVDVRVETHEDARRLEAAVLRLEATTPGTTLRIEGRMGRPPMEPTPRNRALWEMARRAGKTLGLDLGEGRSGGASDGNTTSLYTATLDGLGAVGDGAHARHEFAQLDPMVERTALLALLLLAEPLAAPPSS